MPLHFRKGVRLDTSQVTDMRAVTAAAAARRRKRYTSDDYRDPFNYSMQSYRQEQWVDRGTPPNDALERLRRKKR